MNYKKIYDQIIEKRIKEPYLDGYSELHHIIPSSFGGSNDKSNIVQLSAREHFLCHFLLYKMYPEGSVENIKMTKAFLMMFLKGTGHDGRYTKIYSRSYAVLKENFSIVQSISQTGEKNSQFGTRWKWISNPLTFENKKIRLDQENPEGFVCGFNAWNREKSDLKAKAKQAKLNSDTDMYRNLYNLYQESGWSAVIASGYKFSQPNFVKRCQVLLEEFVPQNGKSRGAKLWGYCIVQTRDLQS